jgi:hypothetical protein
MWHKYMQFQIRQTIPLMSFPWRRWHTVNSWGAVYLLYSRCWAIHLKGLPDVSGFSSLRRGFVLVSMIHKDWYVSKIISLQNILLVIWNFQKSFLKPILYFICYNALYLFPPQLSLSIFFQTTVILPFSESQSFSISPFIWVLAYVFFWCSPRYTGLFYGLNICVPLKFT